MKAVTPDGYAKLVAEDRSRATQFSALLASGDRVQAGHFVAEAAEEIVGYCQGMTSEVARNLAYLMAKKNIDKVGKRSGRRGDETQAVWCAYLMEKLSGR